MIRTMHKCNNNSKLNFGRSCPKTRSDIRHLAEILNIPLITRKNKYGRFLYRPRTSLDANINDE